jgi:hypothetical protein
MVESCPPVGVVDAEGMADGGNVGIASVIEGFFPL